MINLYKIMKIFTSKTHFLQISFAFKRYIHHASLVPTSSTVEISNEKFSHVPVMAKEILDALRPKANQVFLDMTFGGGGHSQSLLKTSSIKLYCLDRDPVAYEKAVELSKEYDGEIIPLLGRFTELEYIAKKVGLEKNSIDGILIDAGCSSMQMDDPKRGFSLSKNSPLDMRMDGNRYPNQPTAADVVNSLDFPSLVKLFKVYGEEKHAKKIAQALIDARFMMKQILTTHELAKLVHLAIGNEIRRDKLNRHAHVATKVFQALRIFVNNELNELNHAMELAYSFLKPGGKLAVLTFHSLEDRIVKRHIIGIDMDEPISHRFSQRYHNSCKYYSEKEINVFYSTKWTSLYKHVVTPTLQEINYNPRSRSAKLRVALKN